MKRFVLSILAALFVSVCLSFTAFAAYVPEMGDGYISFDFNVVANGIVNNRPTATYERNAEIAGQKGVKFTPTPALDTVTANYTLDCFVLGNYSEKAYVPKYKYIGVTYYYAAKQPTFTGKMRLCVINPTTGAYIDSNSEIETGKWSEAFFDMSDTVFPSSDTELYVKQIHLRPFGGAKPSNLSEDDVIYISKYTFYEENPDPDTKVSMRFMKNTPYAVGEEQEILLGKGEQFTVPENPFTYENAVFTGWKDVISGEVVHPGEVYDYPGYSKTYVAQWRENLIVPDHLTFLYPDFFNGVVNGRKTAACGKVEFDDKSVVKVTPLPDGGEDTYITLDGFTYNKAKYKIDLTQYRYLTVEYYMETQNSAPVKMRSDFLSNQCPALTKRLYMTSVNDTLTGQWATALFDFSDIMKYLDPEKLPAVLFQTHFQPFGYTNVKQLSSQDAVYIHSFIFSKEKPEIKTQMSYISGFDDGSFRPGEYMTRAQGCAAVAKLVAENGDITGTSPYDDVSDDAWYSKYIGFLYEKGLLKNYTDEVFLPDSPITANELAKLCTDAYICKLGGQSTVIGETSVMGNYPNTNISRENAVVMINTIFGITTERSQLLEDMSVLFTDVDFRHPAFADIAMASVSHAESYGEWLYVLEDPLERLGENINIPMTDRIAVGNAKIAELDVLERERIEEIRSAPSMDLSHITGKKIYVSNSKGNDSNNGLSASDPFKTIAAANAAAQSGDAVLLLRGDLWRERISAVAGVTYSAYGNADDPKPMIYGSPENGADPSNWTLDHYDEETGAKIWKYANEDMLDVGTIVFNEGEGFAIKEIPTCVGADFYVRGQEELDVKERTPFDYKVELDRNFEFFHRANSKVANNVIQVDHATGPLYLRCDNGNPGTVFDSIEFNTHNTVISAKNSTTFDNLCVKYGGSHGIGSGSIKDLTIQNCEIGWIGGGVQHYNNGGKVVRFGNGVEVYGSCDGYTIENCYVYECYDAGITHQYSGSSEGDCIENNILYRNNVIVDCVYNIEYFLAASTVQKNVVRRGDSVLIEGNLLRRAGYGFGSVRPNGGGQRNIRSGTSRNEFTNFVIRNNILDRAVFELAQTYTSFEITAPRYEGNIYIQGIGNRLFEHSKNKIAYTDIESVYAVKEILGDKTGVIYYTEYIPPYEYTFEG